MSREKPVKTNIPLDWVTCNLSTELKDLILETLANSDGLHSKGYFFMLVDPTQNPMKIIGQANPLSINIADPVIPANRATVTNIPANPGFAQISNGLATLAVQLCTDLLQWQQIRTPAVWKSGQLGAAGDNAIWTPVAGKKFRLMGLVLNPTGNTGLIKLTDNPGGTVLYQTTATAAAFIPHVLFNVNGYLSSAANQVLEMNLTNAVATNYTVWGLEE